MTTLKRGIVAFWFALGCIFLSFTMTAERITDNKPELIYVFDPLCGWCYGFSPVTLKIKERYGDTLDYNVYAGGLVLGDRVATIDEKFGFIKEANHRVEALTGTKFGEGFKKNILANSSTYVLNSVPPGKAFVILKQQNPEKAIEIAHDIQHAIYWDGINIHDVNAYTPVAEKYGMDAGTFSVRFADTTTISLLQKDFEMGAYYQANGYPHVLLRKGEQYYLLARGYSSFEDLQKGIDWALVQGK